MSLNNTFSEKDTHYFALDLHEGAILAEPLKFKQYDHRSRVLSIELTTHNTLLSLQNARVDIWVYKPDGKLVVNEVLKENIDTENSIILVPLTRQMLTTLPKVECEIVVTYADNKVLSFPIFEVEIEDSNMDTEQVISTTEFDMFFASLVRMEQWIRDFETKYNIIEEAYALKLAQIEEQKVRIINEFEALSGDLVQQDAVRFEELKQLTIGEFAEWFTKAKADFAYAGREIEKRFNELWEKCSELKEYAEQVAKEIEQHKQVIEALRKHAEEVAADMDAKYAQFVEMYDDGVRKLQEMESTFAADQAERATAFTNAQNERKVEFTNAQNQRDTEFNTAQANRTSAYNTAEANRNTLYRQQEDLRNSGYQTREDVRDDWYVLQERVRDDAFEAMEVVRNNAETTRRANENERINAEQMRISGEHDRSINELSRTQQFDEMKNVFNEFFLTFRPVEGE